MDSQRFCACGCGGQLPERSYQNRYLPGHNNRTVENRGKLRDSKLGDKNPMKRPDTQRKMRDIRRGTKQPVEQVKARNEKVRKSWRSNPERLIKQRDATKARWQDSSYVQKQMNARHVDQNKAEKLLETLINHITPDFQFIGDGKKIISGKCPDFVNEKKHLIIELFGDYWHKPEEVEPRVKLFESCGYRTLVIWEHELKELEKIKQKILEFTGSPKPV